jgi:hypothetical protein
MDGNGDGTRVRAFINEACYRIRIVYLKTVCDYVHLNKPEPACSTARTGSWPVRGWAFRGIWRHVNIVRPGFEPNASLALTAAERTRLWAVSDSRSAWSGGGGAKPKILNGSRSSAAGACFARRNPLQLKSMTRGYHFDGGTSEPRGEENFEYVQRKNLPKAAPRNAIRKPGMSATASEGTC